MHDHPARRLRHLAAGQDGQFCIAQAHALGCGTGSLRWLRQRGETVLLRPKVHRYAAAPGEPDGAVTAYLACWPHGVVSHGSAAVLHGLARTSAPERHHVTVTGGARGVRAGIQVHGTTHLPEGDVVDVRGVRCTSLARTVCDLADARDPWGTLALLDDAVAAGANPRWVHARARVLAPGRSGVALVRDATDPDGAATFRSWLERTAAHVYRAAGLPAPAWNVPVHDRRGLIGVVDALWPAQKVVSEKEGLRFHTSPAQRRRDAERFNRLQGAGYRVCRFTWEDVVHRPLYVARTVLEALRSAGADLDADLLPARIRLPAGGRPTGTGRC